MKKLLENIVISLVAIPIGMVVAILEVIFVKGISFVRYCNVTCFPFLTIVLPFAGILIIGLKEFANRIGDDVGYGMSYVFDVGQSKRKDIPITLIPFSILASWISQLCGASVGKEGMAVQIGATASNFIGRRLKIEKSAEIFTIAGIAAGFSGLFLKPVAAICFALEVLVAADIKLYALAPCVVASLSSYLTARQFLGDGECYNLQFSFNYEVDIIFKLILLGIIFGITGMIFAYLLRTIGLSFKKINKNKYLLIIIPSIILAIIFIFFGKGRYSGTGSELIELALHNPSEILPYDFILKMLLTIFCLVVGFKGGEVTPLFTIGATMGVVLAKMLNLPIDLVVALGYAAVFGAGTNTFFCPIFIGIEVFGAQNFPLFVIVCSTAYVFNFNHSIYSKQADIAKF